MPEVVQRLDNNTLNAFTRQLIYEEVQAVQVVRPERKAATGRLFQIQTVNAEWAQQTSFRTREGVGAFEMSSGSVTNMPTVQTLTAEYFQNVVRMRSGYEYSEAEMIAAVHLGQSIDTDRIETLYEAYYQTLNSMLLSGEPRAGLPGFLNHPLFSRSLAPYPLDGSVTTVANILQTLNAGIKAVWLGTNQVLEPDTLLLPPLQYQYLISEALMGTNGDNPMSVLNWFRNNNLSVRNIDYLNELQGAGPSGEDVAIFYRRSPDVIFARLTGNLKMKERYPLPYGIYRPAEFCYNGIHSRRPGGIHLMYGI